MSDTAQTFLVVVDETDECAKAVRYAALRAEHTGARLMLLHVLKPSQFLQWGGVQQDMDNEAEQAGQAVLAVLPGGITMAFEGGDCLQITLARCAASGSCAISAPIRARSGGCCRCVIARCAIPPSLAWRRRR